MESLVLYHYTDHCISVDYTITAVTNPYTIRSLYYRTHLTVRQSIIHYLKSTQYYHSCKNNTAIKSFAHYLHFFFFFLYKGSDTNLG